MAELRYIGKNQLALRCEFGEKALVKSIGKGRYSPKHNCWLFPVTWDMVSRIQALFPDMVVSPGAQALIDVMVKQRELVEAAKAAPDANLATELAKVLYPFQRVGVDFAVKAKRILLADDMGLGKTLQCIVASVELAAHRVLVICPNTLKRTWAAEIKKWTPDREVTILGGDRTKKQKALSLYQSGFLVCNYETVRRSKEKQVVNAETNEFKFVFRKHDFVDDLAKVEWDIVIVDEAHNIRNRKAQQTKDVTAAVKQAKNLFLLTGTPIMNKVDELWSLLHLLEPKEYPSFWEFVQRYADAHPGKFGWVINSKPTNPKALRAAISHTFLRREKAEVFKDLPPKTYQRIWVELEGKHRQMYNQMEAEAFVDVDEETQVTALGILAKIVRCKQLAFSPALMGGPDTSPKLDALMDIVTGTNQKVVVFSQYVEVLKLVANRLVQAEIPYVVFTGDTPEDLRQQNVERFQNHPSVRVMLSSIQAGGVGITLTAAPYVVLLDKHWTPALNEQAVDRVYRHGQTQPVTVYEILAADTVDEMVEEVLAGKISIVQAVVAKRNQTHALDTDLTDVV